MIRNFRLHYFTLFIFLLSCGRNGEDSIYLIPKDYEGNLLIIFNQPEGLDTAYEKKARVYRFDTSGVLRTKFSPNYGVAQHQYYYLDNSGNRTHLKYALPSQFKGTDKVVIFNAETGRDFDYPRNVDRHFELLTVGKQIHADSLHELRSNFLRQKLK